MSLESIVGPSGGLSARRAIDARYSDFLVAMRRQMMDFERLALSRPKRLYVGRDELSAIRDYHSFEYSHPNARGYPDAFMGMLLFKVDADSHLFVA